MRRCCHGFRRTRMDVSDIQRHIAASLLICLMAALAPLPVQGGMSPDGFIPVSGPLTGEKQTRTVQARAGDNLWKIARRVNADVDTLMAINNLTEDSVLEIGQYIEVPYSRSRVHRVKAGETLWEIAGMYGVDLNVLMNANKEIHNAGTLQIGQTIEVPASADLRKAVNREYPSRSWKGYYSWPVLGTISSRFGWRRREFHHGLDIACKINTPIRAAAPGKVVFAGVRRLYGKTVILQHANGTRTLYAHARTLLVQEGQQVNRGQTIARVGVTGRTTGPHVHFEVRLNGKTVNPLTRLKR